MLKSYILCCKCQHRGLFDSSDREKCHTASRTTIWEFHNWL